MTILVTGVAGFIGSHVAHALVRAGEHVIGVDHLDAYYIPSLKTDRLNHLKSKDNFDFIQLNISDAPAVEAVMQRYQPDNIVHLAAQAGVRYSITNPDVYVESNLQGHVVMLEMARKFDVSSMVYASSSSVYGGNTDAPFSETDRTDDPVSFYGATKKSNELLSQSYARLYGLSLTGLRFFTVYGPWGRPDMAYWLFAEKMMKREPIQVFNMGEMSRDFTYIDDIVDGVLAAVERPAAKLALPVPHRIYNLGNDRPEPLMGLISALETQLGTSAEKQFQPMQQGDVQHTWADINRARAELGYAPTVSLDEGIGRFSEWFREHWAAYR